MTAYSTIQSAHEALANRDISCVELIQSHLDRIDQVDQKLQTVLTRLDESALQAAAAIDARIAQGETIDQLAGIPFTAKDMFLIVETRTTAASKMLDDFIAPYTGTAVAKLIAAGAIPVAKVNQDEFAHGGSTENSAYFPTHNPRDTEAVPGGSSGGSAAAVAAGIGLFSIGTDTGGSIRQPAAYCGVVGVKPTYGVVSRYGVISMASSLDVVGSLANTVEDAALVLATMAGQDTSDATSIELESYDFKQVLDHPKVAIVKQYMEGLEPAIASIYEACFAKLRTAGWQIDQVSLPNVHLGLPCYYVLTPSEISSNLERYDGIRYGSSDRSGDDLESIYSRSRGDFFGPEVQRRILTGTYALSAGYYDAYYKKAMQVRSMIIADFAAAFENYDILIGPTTPTPAFKLGANLADPIAMYLVDIMTVSANLAGIPALSLPLAGPGELPLGLQLMAPQKGEVKLFSAARQVESALATNLIEVQL